MITDILQFISEIKVLFKMFGDAGAASTPDDDKLDGMTEEEKSVALGVSGSEEKNQRLVRNAMLASNRKERGSQ